MTLPYKLYLKKLEYKFVVILVLEKMSYISFIVQL